MKIVKLPTQFVRFAYFTDVHLSDVPPAKRTKDYARQIMAKVQFIRDLTITLSAVGIFGGDMLHQKSPSARGNTFSLINQLIELLKSFYQGRVWGREGNHDLYMDVVENIYQQPFGTLIASGALENVTDESVIFENADGSVRVQVDSFPYTRFDLEALQAVRNAPPREAGVNHRVVLLHQYGNPGAAPTMFGTPVIGFDQLADTDYDLALWGHDHSRVEPQTVGNCTHIRLGSIARASLAGDEVDRPVSTAILTFQADGIKFKEVEIPVEKLEIAFQAADKQVEKVVDTEYVSEYFRKMDEAIAGIESNDPVEIATKLVTSEDGSTVDRAALDLFCEVCEF